MNNQTVTTKNTLRNYAVASLVGVAFGYAVLGMNSRLLNQGFEPATQVYVRILLGFLLSLVVFKNKININNIKSTPKRDIFWLFVMGVVGYSGSVLFATVATINAKLVNASIIGATVPFIVYIYSFLFLKEKADPRLFINLLPALYGVSIVSSKSFIPNFSNFGTGELFAILSVLALGWWSFGRKMLSDHLNTPEVTVITMIIAGLTALFVAVLRGEDISLQAFTLPPVIIGIIIGAGLNLGLTFLETFAFKNINLVFGNQILMTSTVFSLILGIVFYQEYISISEVIGGLIILFSVWRANKLVKE